jgi:general secretion pathway protein A
LGRRIGFFAVVILLLLFIGFIFFNFQLRDTPRWKIEEIAPQSYESPALKSKESFVPGAEDQKTTPKELPVIKQFDDTVSKDKNLLQTDQIETADQTDQEPTVPQVKPFPDRKIVIYFKHNSNDLPDPAYETLDRIAEFMIYNPEAKVNISGYTDSSGAYSYNVSVSQFRANIVKGYLVGKGVHPLKIEAVGLGPENPIESNETEKGRQANRRVEIELNIDKP